MVLLFCLFHLCVPIYIWLLIIILCLGMQIQRIDVTYLWYILFIQPLDIIYWTTRQLLVKSWDSLTLPWYQLVTISPIFVLNIYKYLFISGIFSWYIPEMTSRTTNAFSMDIMHMITPHDCLTNGYNMQWLIFDQKHTYTCIVLYVYKYEACWYITK